MSVINRNSAAPVFDTLADAISADMNVGQLCIVKNNAADDDVAINYEIKPSGSGGIAMNNGNELSMILFNSASSISKLPIVSPGKTIDVIGYHAGTTVGGGKFIGVSSARHDGGIYIDPNRVGEIGTSAYYTDSGIDAPCWFRVSEDFNYPEFFGAQGGGLIDDTVAIQACIAKSDVVMLKEPYLINGTISISSQKYIFGPGELILNNPTGESVIVTANDVTIKDIKISGVSPGGISIRNGAKRVTIKYVKFTTLGQCVWLFACEEVSIIGCMFYDYGSYAIVQQVGFSSNYCKVIGCYFRNGVADAIELNCETAPSYGWLITNNHYLGAAGWPTIGTEKRFVGCTNVSYVTISNNYIYASAGDSAIHLENSGGENIIANNHFVNCLHSPGGGIIYVLNSFQHTQIHGNNFQQTDPSLPASIAISFSSAYYSCRSDIANNRVVSKNGALLSGIEAVFQDGRMRIANNTFEKLQWGVDVSACSNLSVVSNDFDGCSYGIKDTVTATSGSLTDAVINSNTFINSTGNNISLSKNLSGGAGPKRILIDANKFDMDVTLVDAEDCFASSNIISATKTIDFGTGALRCSKINTFEIGTGLIP